MKLIVQSSGSSDVKFFSIATDPSNFQMLSDPGDSHPNSGILDVKNFQMPVTPANFLC